MSGVADARCPRRPRRDRPAHEKGQAFAEVDAARPRRRKSPGRVAHAHSAPRADRRSNAASPSAAERTMSGGETPARRSGQVRQQDASHQRRQPSPDEFQGRRVLAELRRPALRRRHPRTDIGEFGGALSPRPAPSGGGAAVHIADGAQNGADASLLFIGSGHTTGSPSVGSIPCRRRRSAHRRSADRCSSGLRRTASATRRGRPGRGFGGSTTGSARHRRGTTTLRGSRPARVALGSAPPPSRRDRHGRPHIATPT